MMRRRLSIAGTLLCLGILPLAACAPAATPTEVAAVPSATLTEPPTSTPTRTLTTTPMPTATPLPTHTPAATPTPTPTPAPPVHRIGVRVVDGGGEFYNRITGDTFIPRGNNYIRLANQQGMSGETFLYHSTFNVDRYDPARAEAALCAMHADGYNVVRVFLNGACRAECIGDPSGKLSSAHVANVADFLRRAKLQDIVVILTTDSEPGTPYYLRLLDTTWSEDFGGTNSSYLTQGGILAGKAFWQDLIQALLAQGAPLDAVLAYELRNELFFETNAAPLSLSSGTVTTATGKRYDMASQEDRQRMMDEGLVLWIDQIRAAILELDPTALVTVGFFPPDRPNSWNSAPRYIRTHPAVWESTLDFVDLHPYPGGYSLGKLMENFGSRGLSKKPIVMGELGASRSTYATEDGAAQGLHDWQVDSCHYGFDGWLLWTWDTAEQTDFYNGLEGEGKINQALAPANRPDPCEPGDFFEQNLALGKTVRASRSLAENPPSYAVDGVTSDWWGAGDFAPQWIEIDLGTTATVRLFRLVPSQSPAGKTRHELWVGPTQGELYLLHTFEGLTADLQTLEVAPDTPVQNVRYLRVVTTLSPSWVSWREIEVISP